jgi:hypothetical protein
MISGMAESASLGIGLVGLVLELADNAEADLVVLRKIHGELVVW